MSSLKLLIFFLISICTASFSTYGETVEFSGEAASTVYWETQEKTCRYGVSSAETRANKKCKEVGFKVAKSTEVVSCDRCKRSTDGSKIKCITKVTIQCKKALYKPVIGLGESSKYSRFKTQEKACKSAKSSSRSSARKQCSFGSDYSTLIKPKKDSFDECSCYETQTSSGKDTFRCQSAVKATCKFASDGDIHEDMTEEFVQKVINIQEGNNYIRREIINRNLEGFEKVRADSAVSISDEFTDEGQQLFYSGYQEEGNSLVDIAIEVSDFALNYVPVVNVGKDAYEAITGRRLIDGKEIDTIGRVISAAGVLTLGASSYFKPFLKVFSKVGKKVAAKVGQDALRFKPVANILDTTYDLGVKTKDGIYDIIDLTKRITSKDVENISSISKVINGKLTRYHPLKYGPLHYVKEGSATVADTFRSSSYFKTVAEKPIKLYRVYGGKAGEFSSYWSRVKPKGPQQATFDAALLPDFNNSAKKWVEITIPKDTIFYEGVASEMVIRSSETGIKIGDLLGGGSQVYLNNIKIPVKWRTDRGIF